MEDVRVRQIGQAMRGIAVLLIALLGAACRGGATAAGDGDSSGRGGTIQINGAGATFPYPVYSKWFDEYHKLHPDVQINYQSIGSGGGIRQLSNQTVFFGASDGPMTDEQLAGAPSASLHLPMVLARLAAIFAGTDRDCS